MLRLDLSAKYGTTAHPGPCLAEQAAMLADKEVAGGIQPLWPQQLNNY